jgi:Family of unknown function (DUF6496)
MAVRNHERERRLLSESSCNGITQRPDPLRTGEVPHTSRMCCHLNLIRMNREVWHRCRTNGVHAEHRIKLNRGCAASSDRKGGYEWLRKQDHFRYEKRTIITMPEEETLERAHEAEREGKAPSTQAGEFVREEIEHVRQGKHGARSARQAIAIGLSKARRAGVKLPPPRTGSKATRRKASRETKRAQSSRRKSPSRKRSRATTQALKREGRAAGSRKALSRQTRAAARRRSSAAKSRAARKAARTRRK